MTDFIDEVLHVVQQIVFLSIDDWLHIWLNILL